jgi:hypothetical protein
MSLRRRARADAIKRPNGEAKVCSDDRAGDEAVEEVVGAFLLICLSVLAAMLHNIPDIASSKAHLRAS